jgi:Xaa-Pro dipeptidase
MTHSELTDVAAAFQRQQRLLSAMQDQRLDLVVLTHRAHVQWLTACYFADTFSPMAALAADGHCVLVAPQRRMPPHAAAHQVVPYEAQWHSTLRNDQRQAAAEALWDALAARAAPRRVGVEGTLFGPVLAARWTAEAVEIEPTLYQLRRRKDASELALIRTAIAATGAMYRTARQIVAPGVNELYVYHQLYAAAVEALREPPTGMGNDFACAARGGPPRDRRCQAGELYILDLGPAYRGYFADNCRTLAVGGQPTQEQLAAWEQVAAVFPLIESRVRPGVRCREVFDEVQHMLDRVSPGSFNHHLGHGIGLFPHEAPHLNPRWDDQFEEGDVFTVEPGLYAPQLRAGLRLENNYLVTADGVELLSDFSLQL